MIIEYCCHALVSSMLRSIVAPVAEIDFRRMWFKLHSAQILNTSWLKSVFEQYS